MEKIFSPSRLLAQMLKPYEYRPQQERMAGAVSQAFRQERFLIVEAGTGTGKTLAYLVPAALNGKRVVISTGTKTLQEQLFFRDIPFIREKLGYPFKASFMKGRGNYLCRRRFKLFSRQPMLRALEEVDQFQNLKKWAGRTKTGDRAELEDLPEDLGLWKEINALSETCLGQGCEFFEHCFITRMRQEAAGSDLIIVNHHLLFADLAVRQRGYGEALPRHDAVILDEAHQLEEVATQYFGTVVSNYRFEELDRDIRRERAAAKRKDETLSKTSEEILASQERFFGFFRKKDTRYRLKEKEIPQKGSPSAAKLMERLTLLSAHIGGMKEPSEGFRALSRRAEELQQQLQEVLGGSDPKRVYWCEVRGKGVFLHASPIDVSAELKEQLYDRVKVAIFTSATISTQGTFRFFKERMGLEGSMADGTEELILASPFPMDRQALLYLPEGIPDPNQANFVGRAAAEIEKILKHTRGRAFLLFTSIKNMEEAYGLLKKRLP